MTYKQLEASREARLWIGQIIIPVATIIGTSMAIPQVREAVAAKADDIKESINRKRKKKSQPELKIVK